MLFTAVPFASSDDLAVARHLPLGRHQAGDRHSQVLRRPGHPQWKATTQDILRQVDAVKGHRQKYVTYPDGTRYRVKRAKDADYTTDTGHEVEVWELVPEP